MNVLKHMEVAFAIALGVASAASFAIAPVAPAPERLPVVAASSGAAPVPLAVVHVTGKRECRPAMLRACGRGRA